MISYLYLVAFTGDHRLGQEGEQEVREEQGGGGRDPQEGRAVRQVAESGRRGEQRGGRGRSTGMNESGFCVKLVYCEE